MQPPSVIAGTDAPIEVLVTGASGGIGRACVQALAAHPQVARVHAWSRRAGTVFADAAGRVQARSVDLTDPVALQAAAAALAGAGTQLQLVLNAAGLLHAPGVAPERRLADLDATALQRVFALNAFMPALLARALEPCIPRGAPAVFASLSARVGSIGDNRLGGWYAYRAAKAAHNQLLRTLSIEWRRTHPQACVLMLHPGTVDTPLSHPFQARVPAAGLFDADTAARHLLAVIATATAVDSGRFIAWDGRDVPW